MDYILNQTDELVILHLRETNIKIKYFRWTKYIVNPFKFNFKSSFSPYIKTSTQASFDMWIRHVGPIIIFSKVARAQSSMRMRSGLYPNLRDELVILHLLENKIKTRIF